MDVPVETTSISVISLYFDTIGFSTTYFGTRVGLFITFLGTRVGLFITFLGTRVGLSLHFLAQELDFSLYLAEESNAFFFIYIRSVFKFIFRLNSNELV